MALTEFCLARPCSESVVLIVQFNLKLKIYSLLLYCNVINKQL